MKSASPDGSVFGGAVWITTSIRGGPRSQPPAPYFRKPFTLPKPVTSATLHVTALGLYEAEINGIRVGDLVFAPGWTDYKHRVQFQTHDVASLLKEGENVLGFILGEGWYSGTIGWHLKRQHYGDLPQLLARLDVVFQDDTSLAIVTDNTWKTAVGPILENDFLMGETYDARLELGAWSRPNYEDRAWDAVETAPPAALSLHLSEGPPVRRIEEIRPISSQRYMRQGREIRIYDLGQNFSGRVRLSVRSGRGRTITLRFAEILNGDGSLYTENLRGARTTDHYTCKSEKKETWEPRFTFHGFRYVELDGLRVEEKGEVVGIVLHSDTPATGKFACSNPLLNQLQSNIVWGQRSNFLEVPTDCPQRDERLGWTGDAQVFIRTAAFNMDVRGFFHKWMRDIRDAQNPSGGIPPVAPKVVLEMEDGGPAWSDAMIICPWTIYLCYGDRKILEDNYQAMALYLQFIENNRSVGYIRSHPEIDAWGGFGDWLSLDGGGKTEGITPKDLIGTAFYAYDTEIMAKIAEVLGKSSEARRFRKLHGKIVEAFRRRFITAKGLIVAGTQTAYVLALHFGLFPTKLRPLAAKTLARDIEERGFHLATGFVGTTYVLSVLEEHGYLDTAYRLLEQETFPSWLFPVKNGATTIWERWDGWTPEKGPQDKAMNSYNHYAYGAMGTWMYSTVAGLDLDPAEPGYSHILFRPRPGGSLKWAEAELKTAKGVARIRWMKTRHSLKLELLVPPGSRATLIPPVSYGKKQSLGSGQHRLLLKGSSQKQQLK